MKINSTKPTSVYKVVIVGDSSVGKTSIINRYCQQNFSFGLTSTIGLDYKVKSLQTGQCPVKLQIWDTAGQERYLNMTKSFFKKVNAIIFVFSIADPSSFRNIQKWYRIVGNEVGMDVPSVLVGSKLDLYEQRKVSREEGATLASKYKTRYMEVSSKLDYNISEAFEQISSLLVHNQEKEDCPIEQHTFTTLSQTKKKLVKCIC